jgi:hypothetical protein
MWFGVGGDEVGVEAAELAQRRSGLELQVGPHPHCDTLLQSLCLHLTIRPEAV